jgi:hypothetical protein
MNKPKNATHGPLNAALSFSTSPRNTIMSITTHNTDKKLQEEFNGVCVQGHVDAGYKELVEMLGKPTKGDGHKVDAEWYIRFEDGGIASIYNYKDGKNYNGQDGKPTDQIRDWHIGGFDRKSADRVQILVDLHREQEQTKKNEAKPDGVKQLESAFEIMDSLKAARGEVYANAVETAMLIKKMGDLQHVLLLSLVETDVMPKVVAKRLTEIQGDMGSRVISLIARHAKGVDATEKHHAKELMGWAEKMMGQEQKGVESLLKEILAGGDDK